MGYVIDAERLSAALLEIEDKVVWDATTTLDRALTLERQAQELGDELLAARARLCQANMHMRSGDLAGSARRVWKVHQWAVDHDARQLAARAQLIWAYIHRHLGDAAQSLEHAVLAVELLDDTATEFMQIWHRAKLADALGLAGSMDAARVRYQQAADLASDLDQTEMLLHILNNYAYTEYTSGNPERAQEVAEQLKKRAIELDFELDPASLDTIGSIEVANGRYAEAEQTMQLCIERYSEGGITNADAVAEYQVTLARAQRGLGAYARAQATLDAARETAVERGLGEMMVRIHQEQAELHASRGEFAEAFAVHKIFFASHNRMHSLQRESRARTRQAMFETTEARQEAERFREQARRDPLTGLRNRRYVDEQLPGLIDTDLALTLAIVDLDHFKRVNDLLSHDVGDQVLVQVAKLLETELAAVSPDGFVARMGGEEFLMVLPDIPADRAHGQVDGIRRAIADYDWAELVRNLPVTVSIGLACLSDAEEPTQSGLLSIADRNLYAAKHGGRDQVVRGAGRSDQARSYRDSASAA
ncbi:MAG: diguanylate cyclase [Actinoplanes sp.]